MLRHSFYTIFLTLFTLAACQKNAPEPSPVNMPDPVLNPKPEFTYLALGDSYTIGESVPETDRWGVQLAGLLRDKGLAVGNPVTIARTGWTTAELTAAIEEAKLTGTFDLVSLLIGVNNQYRRQSIDTYRLEFRNLLQIAAQYAKNDSAGVLVLSIPDWGVTPFAQGYDRSQIAKEIDAFNVVAKEEAQKAGIAFVDITPITRSFGADLSYLAPDELHYSRKMHGEWAQLALPKAQQKILK